MHNKPTRNRTINLSEKDLHIYTQRLFKLTEQISALELENKTICQSLSDVLDYFPESFVDLMFIDPPYNLDKVFNNSSFKEMTSDQYEKWIDSWLSRTVRLLKPEASIYICGDWRSSAAVFNAASKYFRIQNRITWEREKGRGAKSNWKSCSEDIWFCTLGKKYCFNVEDVKIKRKVIAPYKDENGLPKDWLEEGDERFRLTYPSNMWTDLTVPFWSMRENTAHPTQKPEKLLAKIILASSNKGDLVFDPFLGSGTTSVVAKKLGRRYLGIEQDRYYCCLAEKRLDLADIDKTIQGVAEGIFLERTVKI